LHRLFSLKRRSIILAMRIDIVGSTARPTSSHSTPDALSGLMDKIAASEDFLRALASEASMPCRNVRLMRLSITAAAHRSIEIA
jgi:hypothetical protein